MLRCARYIYNTRVLHAAASRKPWQSVGHTLTPSFERRTAVTTTAGHTGQI
jgi:hypothetical protein